MSHNFKIYCEIVLLHVIIKFNIFIGNCFENLCTELECVREVMGSIPVGDSDIFFVPRSCHVE